MAKYILIYDTGDSLFDTQKEALKFVKYLKKKGHRVDRLQLDRYSGRTYKTRPKVVKRWKRWKWCKNIIGKKAQQRCTEG